MTSDVTTGLIGETFVLDWSFIRREARAAVRTFFSPFRGVFEAASTGDDEQSPDRPRGSLAKSSDAPQAMHELVDALTGAAGRDQFKFMTEERILDVIGRKPEWKLEDYRPKIGPHHFKIVKSESPDHGIYTYIISSDGKEISLVFVTPSGQIVEGGSRLTRRVSGRSQGKKETFSKAP